MGCRQSSVMSDVESQKTCLLDVAESQAFNEQKMLKDIDELFRKNWNEFVEEKCIVARDKYVPVKTLIYAFTFHLTRNEPFMNLYKAYNKTRYPKYYSVDHIVHLYIYNLLDDMKDKGVCLSAGFGPNEEIGSRYYHYIHKLFCEERIVIGLSVERFQKAN